MLPNDPVILLSFLNTKLRDVYKNIDELCDDLCINKNEIINKMKMIDYEYSEQTNQFI